MLPSKDLTGKTIEITIWNNMWYSRVVTISAGQLNNFGNRFEAGKLYYFNMSSSGAGSMVYSPTRSIGGVKWATGSSMRPTICNLDVVEICPVERGAIRRYHVVLAQLADGRYVIHRVVRVVRSGGGDGGLVFVLMGDANLVQREMYGYENIIGRVRVGGGFFLGFLRPLRLAVAVVLKYKLKFLKS